MIRRPGESVRPVDPRPATVRVWDVLCRRRGNRFRAEQLAKDLRLPVPTVAAACEELFRLGVVQRSGAGLKIGAAYRMDCYRAIPEVRVEKGRVAA